MSSNELRDLFEACKTGDLVKVKKLLTPQNVNEIGKIYGRIEPKVDSRTRSLFGFSFRHGREKVDSFTLR